MSLTDTHCHIHSKDYPLDADDVLNDAIKQDVQRMICVGEDLEDSKLATEFVSTRQHTWASVGVHPHFAKHYAEHRIDLDDLSQLVRSDKVVAIGECGLDYYYDHSTKSDQRALLEFQMDMARKNNLPLIFHVRDAFDDFWPIFDNFKGLRGVLHSFTAYENVLNEALARDLYIGLNGIITFTKDIKQTEMATQIPITKLVLETDAPYLTPNPLRGSICQPKHVRLTAEFLGQLRKCSLEEISNATSSNAEQLFNLNSVKD